MGHSNSRSKADVVNMRNYTDPVRDSVEQFYRLNHQNQSYDFASEKRAQYGALNRANMGIWQALKPCYCGLIDRYFPDSIAF